MKKILISPDFLYQISLYLLLPNLATTKFLILKQAKKLVMRMSTRKVVPGKRNIVGARVTEARSAAGMLQKDLLTHLQVAGMEISNPALSLLEGQERPVSDIAPKALSEILNVDVRWLFGQI